MEEILMASPNNQLPLLDLPQGCQRQLGSLLLSKGMETFSLPLASVAIAARVINSVAQVTVKQVFSNTFNEHLEAVYIFPLAPASAIFSFNMKVADRVIKGQVEERAEARRQYAQALSDGKRTALLEQERDDVFTVHVGNLPPGEEVTIEISYSERLPFFENGCSELRLPLVVAPRYIPGSPVDRGSVGDGSSVDTDLVRDASRISPPRLAQGVDPRTALKVKVEIMPDGDASFADLSCSQHATKMNMGQGGLTVSLVRIDERLNRDFVLRWRGTSDNVKTSLITYKSDDGQTYGLLSIMPPRRAGYLGAARDIIFVLDRSGSMQGIKMTSAVRACSILLNTLGPKDRFAIAAFDNTVEWMPGQDGTCFVHADSAGVENGEKYLRTITARGGTEMDRALRSSFDALNNRRDREGRMPSLVVLTDGEVGNESQILQRIQKEIGDARLFTVGIDTAVNSGLLKRLASLGGGTAAFVEPGVQLEEALTSIAREIGAPLVTDLQVEGLDLSVDRASFAPSRIPDLFAGRASVCFFQLKGKGKLLVKGKLVGGKIFEEKVKAQNAEIPAIAQLWAKAHINDLEDLYRIDVRSKSSLKKQIIDIAVKHSLLTRFTAFVIVDEAEIVNKSGSLRKVVQPVEMPEAWEMADQCAAGAWGGAAASGSCGGSAKLRSLARYDAAAMQSLSQNAPAPSPLCSSPSYSCAPAPSAPPAPPAPPVPPGGDVKKCQNEESGLATGGPPTPVSSSAKSDTDSSCASGASVRDCFFFPSPPPVVSGSASVFETLFNFFNSRQTGKVSLKPELEKCKSILLEFFQEFEKAFQKLEKGELPDASSLENLRVKLVQVLAPTRLGMELPCLQRFLRATGVELVSSLKDNAVTLADLQDFWKSKQVILEEIKREITDLLSGTESAFWDCSI